MSKLVFNNGFVTALALFYGHRNSLRKIEPQCDIRLYAAADHLFDLEYPENLPESLKVEIERFVAKALEQRLNFISKEEAEAVFDECVELLKKIDERFFELKVEVNCP